ncbi:MAG: tRNA/rRNA methyltransferase SpoU [Candidatus Peribacteria bacterium]|nr:tRNA/rRNA methyltransferase SpoU [Candidatus Peribacteria bacterium]
MRSIIFLAHNVRSLWNVGSFFRTADAFAVEKIYLTGYTGHPPRKEITKTALGADKTMPWEHVIDPADVVRQLQADGWTIASLELHPDAIDIQRYKPPEKICIIVGHELTGVTDELLKLSDVTLKIPMLGAKESLNVAVAAGIALSYIRFA